MCDVVMAPVPGPAATGGGSGGGRRIPGLSGYRRPLGIWGRTVPVRARALIAWWFTSVCDIPGRKFSPERASDHKGAPHGLRCHSIADSWHQVDISRQVQVAW